MYVCQKDYFIQSIEDIGFDHFRRFAINARIKLCYLVNFMIKC